MNLDIHELAAVQYGDYRGSVAADPADFKQLSEWLGLHGRLIRLDIAVYGGRESAVAYVVEDGFSWDELCNSAQQGRSVLAKAIEIVQWSPSGHGDTNPPPLGRPIVRLQDILSHSFKRLEIRLVDQRIPPNVRFEIEHA